MGMGSRGGGGRMSISAYPLPEGGGGRVRRNSEIQFLILYLLPITHALPTKWKHGYLVIPFLIITHYPRCWKHTLRLVRGGRWEGKISKSNSVQILPTDGDVRQQIVYIGIRKEVCVQN